MKKLKKMVSITVLVLACLLIPGCGIIRDDILASKEQTGVKGTCDSSKLIRWFYIWHDENQTNILKDIGTDISKFQDYTYNIFEPVYLEESIRNVDSNSSSEIVWMMADNDKNIPTFYKGDELILYCPAEETIPSIFEMDRFYDHGYSIGVYGLKERAEGSNLWELSPSSNCGLKSGSDASALASALNQEYVVVMPYIGDQTLTAADISNSGTIKNLKKGSTYQTNLYVGTERKVLSLTANVRIFSFMESFEIVDYEYLGKGIIKINLPDYMKTGYYVINNCGMFRYVDGNKYDNDTNFNDPIVVKDSEGNTIYNPIKEAESEKRNNGDAVNDSQYAPSALYTVDVSSSVGIDITFKNSTETEPPIPQIIYYSAEKESFYLDNNELGSKNNPYVIELTPEEIKAGRVKRVLEKEDGSIQNGKWVFQVTNIGSYKIHTETFEAIYQSNYSKYYSGEYIEETESSAEQETQENSNISETTAENPTENDSNNYDIEAESLLLLVADAEMPTDFVFYIDEEEQSIEKWTSDDKLFKEHKVACRYIPVCNLKIEENLASMTMNYSIITVSDYALLSAFGESIESEVVSNYLSVINTCIEDDETLLENLEEQKKEIKKAFNLSEPLSSINAASRLYNAAQKTNCPELTAYIEGLVGSDISEIIENCNKYKENL